MKTYELPEDELEGRIYERVYLLVTRKGGGWQAAVAAFGLASGVLSAPLALGLWTLARFAVPLRIGAALHSASTVLFVLTLPLLALGACCLDGLERKLPALPLPSGPRRAASERGRHIRPRHPHLN